MNQQLIHNYFESHKGIWSWIPRPTLDDIDPMKFNKEAFENIKRADWSSVFLSFEMCHVISISCIFSFPVITDITVFYRRGVC